MPIRSILHLILSIPTLIGVGIVLMLIAKAGSSDLSEDPAPKLIIEAWNGILGAIPAEMPPVFPDSEEEIPESVEDLSAEEKLGYPRTNAFILSCSLLVLAGVFGLNLMGASLSSLEPIWYGFLRTGTLCAVTLGGFILFGFNVAFPGDSVSILPIPSFYLPGEIDSVEYGLNGISEWADLLFIGVYSLFFAALVLSLAHGRLRSSPLFLIAIPASTIIFPIVVSWKWGGGWIDMLLNNLDFAGAALLHWHAGIAILIIGLVATIVLRSRKSSLPTASGPPNPLGTVLYIVGGLLYLSALLAINTGSALEATPAVVTPILQATLIASGVSGVFGILWALLSDKKPILRYLIVGAAGGMVAVSGATDLLTPVTSVIFGIFAGILIPGAAFLLERLNWTDPLSIGVTHAIGGLIAILGTAFVASEDATIIGQLVLTIMVPILTLIGTLLVSIVAASTGFLFLPEGEKSPPPVPAK